MKTLILYLIIHYNGNVATSMTSIHGFSASACERAGLAYISAKPDKTSPEIRVFSYICI